MVQNRTKHHIQWNLLPQSLSFAKKSQMQEKKEIQSLCKNGVLYSLMGLGYDGNIMGDLERQIICNIASDHQQRLLKSTLCRLRQKTRQNEGGCEQTKIQKKKVERKAFFLL